MSIPEREKLGALPEALDAVVGLGSNLGDSVGSFRTARSLLAAHMTIIASSSIYRSRPMGGPIQPDYANGAIRVSARETPHSLLQRLLAVEAQMGRVRAERWGPRTIDLDLLWIRGVVVSEHRLTVPHSRLRERPFALQPLLDVAPQEVDPRDGLSYLRVLEGLDDRDLKLLARNW